MHITKRQAGITGTLLAILIALTLEPIIGLAWAFISIIFLSAGLAASIYGAQFIPIELWKKGEWPIRDVFRVVFSFVLFAVVFPGWWSAAVHEHPSILFAVTCALILYTVSGTSKMKAYFRNLFFVRVATIGIRGLILAGFLFMFINVKVGDVVFQCDDEIDNDGDGLADEIDPDCKDQAWYWKDVLEDPEKGLLVIHTPYLTSTGTFSRAALDVWFATNFGTSVAGSTVATDGTAGIPSNAKPGLVEGTKNSFFLFAGSPEKPFKVIDGTELRVKVELGEYPYLFTYKVGNGDWNYMNFDEDVAWISIDADGDFSIRSEEGIHRIRISKAGPKQAAKLKAERADNSASDDGSAIATAETEKGRIPNLYHEGTGKGNTEALFKAVAAKKAAEAKKKEEGKLVPPARSRCSGNVASSASIRDHERGDR